MKKTNYNEALAITSSILLMTQSMDSFFITDRIKKKSKEQLEYDERRSELKTQVESKALLDADERRKKKLLKNLHLKERGGLK